MLAKFSFWRQQTRRLLFFFQKNWSCAENLTISCVSQKLVKFCHLSILYQIPSDQGGHPPGPPLFFFENYFLMMTLLVFKLFQEDMFQNYFNAVTLPTQSLFLFSCWPSKQQLIWSKFNAEALINFLEEAQLHYFQLCKCLLC